MGYLGESDRGGAILKRNDFDTNRGESEERDRLLVEYLQEMRSSELIALAENAIELQLAGVDITIRTFGGGTYCVDTVNDFGHIATGNFCFEWWSDSRLKTPGKFHPDNRGKRVADKIWYNFWPERGQYMHLAKIYEFEYWEAVKWFSVSYFAYHKWIEKESNMTESRLVPITEFSTLCTEAKLKKLDKLRDGFNEWYERRNPPPIRTETVRQLLELPEKREEKKEPSKRQTELF